MAEFTDNDFRNMVWRSIRLVLILAAVATPLIWWKLGWQSAALLWVGTAISASGIWKWLRLMTAMMLQMDAGAQPRPISGVLLWFFIQMGAAGVALYVSLKFLDGSVYALLGGILLGLVALSTEGLRAMNSWTK